jgi:hypothetical protein
MIHCVRSLLILASLSALSCSTVPPTRFAERAALQHVSVEAKPWVMYGAAPVRWLVPEGELVIDVHEATAVAIVGTYSLALAYTVTLESGSEPGLRCDASSDKSHLLACHGPNDVELELGGGCRYPDDLLSPPCRRAVLHVAGQRFHVEEGWVETLGVPSGELSIVDRDGDLVAAANIVSEMRFDVWVPPARAKPFDRRLALMVIAAYHQWEHRKDPS